MKRLVVIPVVLLSLLAASCDALGDDLAAIVEGIGIKVTEVEAFAADQPDQNAFATAAGTLAGGAARQSLSSLIVYALVTDELERREVGIDPGQQAAMTQQLEANPQFAALPEAAQELVAIGETRVATLNDVLTTLDPSDPDELADLYDRTPSLRSRRCLEAVFVPADQAAQIDELLDAGQSLGEILLSGETSAEGLVGGATECLAASQYASLPPEVIALIDDSPIGATSTAPITVPNGEFVVYVTVIDDIVVEPGDAEVQRTLTQIVEGGIGPWIQTIAADADIEIDPRFGTSFDAATLTVLAPEAPLAPPTDDPFIAVP